MQGRTQSMRRGLGVGGALGLVLMLGACGIGLERIGRRAPAPVVASDPAEAVQASPLPRPAAASADAYDTSTAAERAAAAAPQAAGVLLGKTIASLGDPTQEGFWLKTGLVEAPAKGRVVVAATGASVALDLIPSGGAREAGSQMSLPALRLLGVGLTDLSEMEVYRQ